jgi:hypothetical protein
MFLISINSIVKNLICLFLVLLSQNVIAAVGIITDQVNKAPEISRASKTIVGNKGVGVEMNDSIRTQKGKIGIKFADDTTVQINENSKLVIDDFVYDPKASKNGHLAIKVALGTVRYASGQIAKNSPQNVSINTPSASVAVRGTDFSATVDELGGSTIILLPSCKFGWIDVNRDCITGVIEVSNEAGSVILNKPYEATKVQNSGTLPSKPIIISLSPDAINNMLIVSPPPELGKQDDHRTDTKKGALDVDYLRSTGLANALDLQKDKDYQDKLSKNLLDQDFLANILDIINAQMASQLNMLSTQKSGLLPDWTASSGVTVSIDDPQITLCRSDGSNNQCVTTQKNQNTTIYQQQGSIEIRNRINSGGSSIINLRQN